MTEYRNSLPKYRSRADRYLEIVAWLRKRYSANGAIITYVGMEPTLYTRLVDSFGARYA
jgi:hypothetical protein